MNIHRYLLPATIAATVHVALLWLLPEEEFHRIIAVTLKPARPPDPPPVPEPPLEREPDTGATPVKPLLGKPAPPELEEIPPAKLPDHVFEMPVDTRPRKFEGKLPEIPSIIGDPNGVPNGIDPSQIHIFAPGDLDGAPRAKTQIPPEYPYAKKQRGEGGSVLVEFDVDTTGRVIRAEAVRCSDRDFAEPAVRAVRNWRFEPGRRNGKAVPFRMTVPIEFGIENG